MYIYIYLYIYIYIHRATMERPMPWFPWPRCAPRSAAALSRLPAGFRIPLKGIYKDSMKGSFKGDLSV